MSEVPVAQLPLVGELEMSSAARLERLQRIARLMDSAFQVPGTKFRVGLDSLIGLVPGIGDVVTAGFAAYIVREASKMGVSRGTLIRMLTNVGVDCVVGAIPLLGDLFDVAFKANLKNLALLEKSLAKAERQAAKSRTR